MPWVTFRAWLKAREARVRARLVAQTNQRLAQEYAQRRQARNH